MAITVQDSMRVGPRGSSDQVAFLGPKVVPLGAGPLAQITEFDESGAGQNAMYAPFFPSEEGYKVNRVFGFVTEAYTAEGRAINVGTSAGGSGAVFVSGYKVPNGTGLNSTVDIPLNGTGAGKDPLADGNSAFLVGGGVNQQLLCTVAGGAGQGKICLFAELIPVSGTRFSN